MKLARVSVMGAAVLFMGACTQRVDTDAAAAEVRAVVDQYNQILRLQQLVDIHLSTRLSDHEWFKFWFIEISTSLDVLNRALAVGRWRREEVSRLAHLYRHALDR